MSKKSKNDNSVTPGFPKQRPYFMSPAFIAAAHLRQNKSDYGDIESYFPFEAQSYVHEIYKKAKRLVNLVKTGQEPNCESIEDNLLDIINYASYYYEFLTKKEG